MTSSEIFSTICRVTGQMALYMGRRPVTRQMIFDWADTLDTAVRELRRLAS